MNDMDQLINEIAALDTAKIKLHIRIDEFFKGRIITITNEYFNGQPMGNSWPKLKGKQFVIDHTIIENGKISVWFQGDRHYCYMPLSFGDVLV